MPPRPRGSVRSSFFCLRFFFFFFFCFPPACFRRRLPRASPRASAVPCWPPLFFRSMYNSVMKVTYLLASAAVVYMLRAVEPYKSSYKADAKHDTFLHWYYAVGPCAVLALLANYGNFSTWHGAAHWAFEALWAFSIYLEAVAIAPQLILLQRHKSVENITSWYVASLGAYRALYIVNWVWRFYHEAHFNPWIEFSAGVIQTVFYLDFFYYFLLSKAAGLKTVVLPQ